MTIKGPIMGDPLHALAPSAQTPGSPRLPSMPTLGYSPPVVQPQPRVVPAIQGRAADYETATIAVPWPLRRSVGVYTMQKRWRACDVYVSWKEPAVFHGYIVSIFVYVIAGSSRVLVASGRMTSADETNFPRWMVSARAGAERYEVVAHVAALTTSTLFPLTLDVTVVGTDEASDPPPGVGEIIMCLANAGDTGSVVNGAKFGAANLLAPPFLQAVRVQGVNTAAAAARYLQLYDSDFTTFALLAASGRTPMQEWGLGATAGQGVTDSSVNFRALTNNAVMPFYPSLVVSSTPGVYTVPADGACYLTVR